MGSRKKHDLPITPRGAITIQGFRAKAAWGVRARGQPEIPRLRRVSTVKPKPPTVYDIELVDTKFFSRTIRTGQEKGQYPLAALKKFAEKLPPNIDLSEMRTPEFSRYVFLHSKIKGRR